MSEQEPGTRPASTAVPAPTVAAPTVPVQRLGRDDVLTGSFTPERAAALAAGRSAVDAACTSVFPPRPEDPRGALLPVDLQREANCRIAAALGRTTSAVQRVWLLEGVVVGFAEQAAAALLSHGHTDPAELLRARAQARPAPTAPERAAVDTVLAVLQSCTDADPVALAWAVECLWSDALHAGPGDGGAEDRAMALERDQQLRTVLSVAASACSACLYLALNG